MIWVKGIESYLRIRRKQSRETVLIGGSKTYIRGQHKNVYQIVFVSGTKKKEKKMNIDLNVQTTLINMYLTEDFLLKRNGKAVR
jgi:hypothetical protein